MSKEHNTTDFEEVILKEFPLPIAYEYRQLVDILKDPRYTWFRRCIQAESVFEFILRYCTTIALSYYLKDLPRRTDSINALIADHIYTELDIGYCMELLEKVLGLYRETPETFFIPKLCSFFYLLGGDSGDTGERILRALQLASIDVDVERMAGERAEERFEELYKEHYCPHLEKLLGRLEFLKDYPLLRLLTWSKTEDKFRWEIKILRGTNLDPQPSTWDNMDEAFKEHQLAIWDPEKERLLYVHPFSIFHSCKDDWEAGVGRAEDFFTYKRINGDRIKVMFYIGLGNVLGGGPHTLRLSDYMDVLIQLVPPPEAEEKPEILAWDRLQDTARKCTLSRLFQLKKEKYVPDVYVEREEIEAHFRRFLSSDKKGLLVVGGSGTGKTNLLCHWAESELETNNIVLLYNCAQLRGDGLNLATVIARDLGMERGLTETLNELAEQRKEKNGQVLVFLDAVNEYAEPATLLNSVFDDLLKWIDYKWFRVILACRSESWGWLRFVLEGQNAFYAVDGEVDLRLDPFSSEELENAYREYRRKYTLQTPFEELSERAKRFMKDPLNLKLVAESYKGEAVPKDVETVKVYERYIETKLSYKDPRYWEMGLEEEDLVERLVEKMHRTKGQELSIRADLLTDEQLGRQVLNAALTHAYWRLIDKGVLQHVGRKHGKPERMKFSYDRVFEFLLSEQIFPEKPTVDDVIARIDEAHGYLSLLGAVKIGLIRYRDMQLLAELARSDDVDVRDMVVETLTALGWEWPEETNRSVRLLLDSDSESAKLVAIYVADKLEWSDILEGALYDNMPKVRSTAVAYCYYLWNRNPEKGQELILHLSKNTSLRNLPALSGLISISGIISAHLMSEQERERVLTLLPIWQRAFQRIPGIKQSRIKTVERLKAGVRSRLIQLVMPLFQQMLGEGGTYSRQTFGPFFELSEEQRRELARYARYIDPEAGDVREVEDTLFELAQIQDFIVSATLMFILVSQSVANLERIVSLIRRMFEGGNRISKFTARQSLAIALITLGEPPEEYVKLLEEYMLWAWTSEESSIILEGREYDQRVGWLSFIMASQCRVYSGVPPVVKKLLEAPWPARVAGELLTPEENRLRREAIVIRELGLVGRTLWEQRALDGLRPWIQAYEMQDEAIQGELVEALVRIRTRHRRYVDDYLAYWKAPDELVREVKAAPAEPFGKTLIAAFQLTQVAILMLPGGARAMADMIEQVLLEAKDVTSAMQIIVEKIIEVIGGTVA